MILELLQATESAAIACYDWIGRGQEKSADAAATEAMRKTLNNMNIRAEIVIGEGERDKAPMLYIGEKLGALWGKGERKGENSDKTSVDIAVDPLEGTTICARDLSNALSVMAVSEKGGLLNAPDIYMDKIAVGECLPANIVDLNAEPSENIKNLARAKKCAPRDISVAILKRDRHEELIAKTRETGAKIWLFNDGDVQAVLSTFQFMAKNKIDMYCGIGGAPEGVLAACAVVLLGGQMQGRLVFSDEQQKIRAKSMGISDINKKYQAHEMATGKNMLFFATGVTNGNLLIGVTKKKCEKTSYFLTQSLVISNDSTRWITNKSYGTVK